MRRAIVHRHLPVPVVLSTGETVAYVCSECLGRCTSRGYSLDDDGTPRPDLPSPSRSRWPDVSIKKRARRAWNKHVKLRLWSVRNWCKGYKYGPVQRFRCCGHTTPFHYQACPAGERRRPNGRTSS